jgi:16S rRNA C1402 (ribose-2'-O) methylase RsmI
MMLRGEFVIVLEALIGGAAAKQPNAEGQVSMADGRVQVAELVAGGARRADAVRQVAAATGLDRRELYRPD